MNDHAPRSVLMVNLPFSGHTNPTLGLARALTDMGHHVTYVHSPTWRGAVERTGARFVPYDDYPSRPRPSQEKARCWDAAYRTVLRIGGDYDCLVYEMLFTSGKALAERLGIVPIRLFSTFALNERVLEDFGRSGGWYLTSLFRLPRVRALVSKRLSRRFGWRYDDLVDEITRNGPDLNITYTTRSFQLYAEDFPAPRYAFVGAAVDGRTPGGFDAPAGSGPLVYVSLGTMLNNSAGFFRRCVEAFRGTGVRVVMSIGNSARPGRIGPLPPTITVRRNVPQLEVLSRASLFVTHGGMNSVNEALYYGVPMVVVPMGNDQPTVARRVAELGLGEALDARSATPAALRGAALRVMSDQGCRARLAEFQRETRAAGGNAEVARLIIDRLSR